MESFAIQGAPDPEFLDFLIILELTTFKICKNDDKTEWPSL